MYWLLAKETGWTYPEIDALPVTDFNEIAEQWTKGACTMGESRQITRPPAPVVPREVTEEEFQRIVAAEKAFAEKHGGPRNPFL